MVIIHRKSHWCIQMSANQSNCIVFFNNRENSLSVHCLSMYLVFYPTFSSLLSIFLVNEFQSAIAEVIGIREKRKKNQTRKHTHTHNMLTIGQITNFGYQVETITNGKSTIFLFIFPSFHASYARYGKHD